MKMGSGRAKMTGDGKMMSGKFLLAVVGMVAAVSASPVMAASAPLGQLGQLNVGDTVDLSFNYGAGNFKQSYTFSLSGSTDETVAGWISNSGSGTTLTKLWVGLFNTGTGKLVDKTYATGSTLQNNYGTVGLDDFLSAGSYKLVIAGNDSSADGFYGQLTVSSVPLPGAVVLFGSGLLGLVGLSRRRSAAKAA
jgi:hypothetical protein